MVDGMNQEGCSNRVMGAALTKRTIGDAAPNQSRK